MFILPGTTTLIKGRPPAASLPALFIHHVPASRDGEGFPAAVENSLVLSNSRRRAKQRREGHVLEGLLN